MKRILTTHVGSLPTLESVEAVVRRQRELGLDLINEGEYTKGGDWLSYVEERFGGFEPRPAPPGEAGTHHAGEGPRGLRRFLPLRHRARHAVLHARRADQAGAALVALHRADHLSRPARAEARDRIRCSGSRRRRGSIPHHHRAWEPRGLPAQRVLHAPTRNSSTRSPRRCGSSTRRSPRPALPVQVDDAWLPRAVGPHRHPDGPRGDSASTA